MQGRTTEVTSTENTGLLTPLSRSPIQMLKWVHAHACPALERVRWPFGAASSTWSRLLLSSWGQQAELRRTAECWARIAGHGGRDSREGGGRMRALGHRGPEEGGRYRRHADPAEAAGRKASSVPSVS